MSWIFCAISLVDRVFVPLKSMCSRIWDKPAPRCASSSMLPVAHHACTLATGALRSCCTMIVSPFGSTHFCAELGGNAITDESSTEAAFKLAELNIIAMTSAANDQWRMPRDEGTTRPE